MGEQSVSANPPSSNDEKSGTKENDGEKTGGKGNDVPKPSVDYPGDDPTVPPGEDWEWRGPDAPRGDRGAWYNPKTKESLKPDLNHEPPVGPHWDYGTKGKPSYRWYPNGTFELK